MRSSERQNFQTVERQKEVERVPEVSFRNLWERFTEFFLSKKRKGHKLLTELEKSKGSPEQDTLLAEGEGIVGLYDSAMSRVEDEARLEVASLIDEGDEAIEQIPPSQLKRVVWYNLSTTPEGCMSEAERSKYEQFLNFERIEQNQRDWREYLSEKIRASDVVCLGESHTVEIVEKRAVTEFLEQAKENGVTDIGLEMEERLQEYFDRYLETGKFQETDNPEDYEKVGEYQRLCHECYRTQDIEALKAKLAFEKTVKDNFVFFGHFHEHYPMLKKARELGLRVRCIDANQKYSQEEIDQAFDAGTFTEWKQQKEAERDQRMFEKIQGAVADGKGKILVLLGAAHLAEGELSHKNLGDLLSEDETMKSFRINMDRDLDADITVQGVKQKLAKDISFNSVLHTALERRGTQQVGFDLDDSVLASGNKQGEKFPFDGYIKI